MLNTGRKPVSVAPKNRKLIWKVMGHFKGMGRKKVLAAKMLEQGLSSNTIAAELDIHERTVRRVKEKNYLDLPLISYIEEQERKENEKTICNSSQSRGTLPNQG